MAVEKTLYKALSILAVIVLSLILGYLIYINSSAFLKNSTTNVQPQLNVQVQIIYNPTTEQSYLQYFLENNGELPVKITSISVNNYTISQNITLYPGDVYQNIIQLNSTYIQPGVPATVTVQGFIIINDKQFSISTSVIPSS